ncbi:hypothetical protein R4Z10_12640 [Niallia sp. XMNu-256]|uniref:MFS transporter n=1 Tax=Niallia sp. XMNu-256 TaxID=3082444 RepID=UPI0030D5619B
MTGVYSGALGTSASLAPIFSTVLVNKYQLDWEHSLIIWGILVMVGMVIWFPQIFQQSRRAPLPQIEKQISLWFSPLAWQVTLFMGFQSFIFFCMIAWLPEILQNQGVELTTAAWLLTVFQMSGIPFQFITPILAGRLTNQKIIALIIGILNIMGILGLFLSNHPVFTYGCIIVIGISQGGALSYALTLFGLRTTSESQAAVLSGMAQSVGYLLAALGPLTLGILYDQLHNWTLPFVILITFSILMTIVGVAAGHDKVVSPLNRLERRNVVEKNLKG